MTKIKTVHHRTIRKIISAVGSLFDDISLFIYDRDGSEIRRVKVPIVYAPKEKYITRLFADPDLQRKTQISLPRLSYDLVGIDYDTNRKLPATNKLVVSNDKSSRLYQVDAAPFNFKFELYLYVRNIDDGNQLVETILPYFSPDYCINIDDNPEFNDGRTLPIVFNSVRQDIDNDSSPDGRTRIVTWTITFTVRGYLYPPTMEQGIIRKVIVNLFDSASMNANTMVLMLGEGSGNYITGETVFQGVSAMTSDNTARVVSYNPDKKRLIINDISGAFMSNTTLTGNISFAQYDIDEALRVDQDIHGKGVEKIVNPNPTATITVEPDPFDASPEDEWDYDVNVIEYE